MGTKEEQRRSALICAYYLSRRDRKGLERLGCKNFKQAYESISHITGTNPNSLKNMRDEFDPNFPNLRVGWYQRPMRPSRQRIFNEFSHYTDEQLDCYVRQLLYADPDCSQIHDFQSEYVDSGSAEIVTRRGQALFHSMVLKDYHQCCCMTGLSFQNLLQSAHIKSWAASDGCERRDPCNGLCLNPLHHCAFDKGYLTVDTSYHIRVAEQARKTAHTQGDWMICNCEGKEIILPDLHRPSKEFLEWHNDTVFLG